MWTIYAKLYGILESRCTIWWVHPGISFSYIISLFNLKILYKIQFLIFFQEDMKHFRPKLAVILLDSELNKLKGCPLYYQSEDEVVLPNSDLAILDNPPEGC